MNYAIVHNCWLISEHVLVVRLPVARVQQKLTAQQRPGPLLLSNYCYVANRGHGHWKERYPLETKSYHINVTYRKITYRKRINEPAEDCQNSVK